MEFNLCYLASADGLGAEERSVPSSLIYLMRGLGSYSARAIPFWLASEYSGLPNYLLNVLLFSRLFNENMLTQTYQYKLRPTNEQIEVIERHLEAARRVWNYALKERKDWVNSRKCQLDRCSIESEYIIPVNHPRPTFNLQCKSLTQFKKDNPDTELKLVNAQVMQQVLRTLEASFVNMWERGFGFPRFVRRSKSLVLSEIS